MSDTFKVHMIAIGGPSCAGKTMLGKYLAASLQCPVLGLDCYYRDLRHLSVEQRAHVNFDHPSSLDDALLAEHLLRLSRGESLELPVYDFRTHTRSEVTEFFRPGPHVIMEGLFALYWEKVRELTATKFFIDAPDTVCLKRRMQRDVVERGRTAASVLTQFNETVVPMAQQYVRPTKVFADLQLSGVDPIEESLHRVLSHISTVPSSHEYSGFSAESGK